MIINVNLIFLLIISFFYSKCGLESQVAAFLCINPRFWTCEILKEENMFNYVIKILHDILFSYVNIGLLVFFNFVFLLNTSKVLKKKSIS